MSNESGFELMRAMDDEKRGALLREAVERAREFRGSVAERSIPATATKGELQTALGGPIPESGDDPSEVLRALADLAPTAHIASSSPRFFGFVIGGVFPVALGADWLVSAWDQNAGLFVLSPMSSVAEEIAGEWLIDLFGLPKSSSVAYVTGCQMANFTGLAAARHEVLRRAGWNVEENGLQGAPRVRVILGAEAHVTIYRALRSLGLGTKVVEIVEADDQGRMKPEALREVLSRGEGPTIVCAQVGNVNTGACDPVREIAAIAHERGAWLHVDGAFGLWAGATPKYRHLVEGVGDADSWATDAHKWLNVPQDSGIVFVRNSAAHRASMTADAEYLQKSEGAERDSVDWNPEFSRRARALPVYATLRTLGRKGVAALVESCCERTKQMTDLLDRDPRVEILCDVVLNQALVRFHGPAGTDDDALVRRVIARIQKDGVCWLGGTDWHGVTAMRISVSNWATTEADIETSVKAVLAALDAELT